MKVGRGGGDSITILATEQIGRDAGDGENGEPFWKKISQVWVRRYFRVRLEEHWKDKGARHRRA